MSVKNAEKWLLVEWGNGARGVVHSRYMLYKENVELMAGSTITISKRGEQQLATLIARSNERHLLEQMADEFKAGPSAPPEEVGDFSSSASSWEPSDDNYSDSDEVASKKSKSSVYRKQIGSERSVKKVLTPSNRANAVIPTSMRKSTSMNIKKYVEVRKHPYDHVKQIHANETPEHIKNKNPNYKNVMIDMNEINEIKKTFHELFRMLNIVNRNHGIVKEPDLSPLVPELPAMEDEKAEEDRCHSEESNRSDDGILITNKYDRIPAENVQKVNNEDELVPIGSGKTLIPKDKFRRVKWSSYTIATRTLLLAVFPRRTLATHSLTGKRSPAFQNKPAKMCLDPKKIADIIIEVMDRFNVRENLVRSIITTKCADESKMYKTRMGKKKGASTKKEQEEVNTVPNKEMESQTY